MKGFEFVDTFLQSPWFPIVFIALLVLVIMIFPLTSGWKRLAANFPDRKDIQGPEEAFGFQSLRLIFGSYSGVIKATFYREGLRLCVYFPGSISHKPIFIPYEALRPLEDAYSSIAQCRVEASGTSIVFMGSSAEALVRRLKPNIGG